MTHVDCGGMVFQLESGKYWCMNCDQTSDEMELADENFDEEIIQLPELEDT